MPYLYVLYRAAARLISYSEPDFQHGGVAKLFAEICGAEVSPSFSPRSAARTFLHHYKFVICHCDLVMRRITFAFRVVVMSPAKVKE